MGYRIKPPLPQINRGHPLAQGLIAAYLHNQDLNVTTGNNVTDLMRMYDGTLDKNWSMVDSPWGVAVKPSEAGSIDLDAAIETRIEAAEEATLIWILRRDEATPASSADSGCTQIQSSGASKSHYVFTDGKFYCATFRNDRITITPSTNIARDDWHMVVVTNRPGANGWKVYQVNDSFLEEISSQTGEAPMFADKHTLYGGIGTEECDGDHVLTYIYERFFTPSMIAALWADPFCFLRPVEPLWEWDVGPAVAAVDPRPQLMGALY